MQADAEGGRRVDLERRHDPVHRVAGGARERGNFSPRRPRRRARVRVEFFRHALCIHVVHVPLERVDDVVHDEPDLERPAHPGGANVDAVARPPRRQVLGASGVGGDGQHVHGNVEGRRADRRTGVLHDAEEVADHVFPGHADREVPVGLVAESETVAQRRRGDRRPVDARSLQRVRPQRIGVAVVAEEQHFRGVRGDIA